MTTTKPINMLITSNPPVKNARRPDKVHKINGRKFYYYEYHDCRQRGLNAMRWGMIALLISTGLWILGCVWWGLFGNM